MAYRIAIIVGSLRAGSFNRQLGEALTKLPAAAGHHFVFPDIGTLPLYDQDADGAPAAEVTAFKQAVASADAVIFVTPEYNRSIPGVLKNALDQGSRPYGKSVWGGKVAGVIGTSPGKVATALAQQHLRNVLAYLDMPTLNQPEAFVQWSDTLLDDSGAVGEGSAGFLDGWMKAFLALVDAHVS
ncbi:NADPH-dependent FMN reductase [Novosphingobium sp. 9]|uniref:NADPH-dependent FMN reductase n=1 Tax=Novosphingobium sp. 9 TaxID=2025349 RepID=UPI0021B64A0B|nr:NADPH-dependent FMN reductase [Novosphingobium sp. 9]